MILKSIRTNNLYFNLFVVIFLFAYCIFLYSVLFDAIAKWGYDFGSFVLFILPLMPLFIATQKFVRDAKKVIIDNTKETITFEGFFFKIKKIYNFKDLDGYVTGRFIGTNRSLTKVIWIVKNGKMLDRINENYVENIKEMEMELKNIQYLGHQSITNTKRIQMVFMQLKITKLS